MGGEDHCRQLLYQAAGEADLILVEGVMGLFDGDCSSADLAALFGIPVMAVIDASHMAQTFGALVLGLARYRPGLPFAGAFANRLAGERHYQMLADALPPGLPCLGWLPREANIALPARHLGLVQAAEIADLEARLDQAAAALRLTDLALPAAVNFRPALAVMRRQATPLKTKDIPVTFTLTPGTLHSYQANADPPPPHPLPRGEGEPGTWLDADTPSPLVGEGWGEGGELALNQRKAIAQPQSLAGVRIAVARDAAFAFLYRANLELLQALGAELAFFSPLADPELPPADALYLPGGYPELHLERLAANQALLAAVRAHHAADKPILAECGGMLYLMESLTDQQGRTWATGLPTWACTRSISPRAPCAATASTTRAWRRPWNRSPGAAPAGAGRGSRPIAKGRSWPPICTSTFRPTPPPWFASLPPTTPPPPMIESRRQSPRASQPEDLTDGCPRQAMPDT